MPAQAQTTAHFSIDGEWFTGICRDWVIEGRWDRAMKALVNDIPGFGHDRAVQLLRGEMKLVGRDDLDFVVDTDCADYLKQLDFMFGGCFVDQHGQYLRPYAVVTSWCEKDMMDSRDSEDRSTPKLTKGSEIGKSRRGKYSRNPLTYADDPLHDVCRLVNINSGQESLNRGLPLGSEEAVICRVIPNFPHLIVNSFKMNDIRGTINHLYNKGIPLRETGASQYYGVEKSAFMGGGADALKDQPVDLDDDSLNAARRRFLADPAKRNAVLDAMVKTDNVSVDALRQIILAQAGDDLFDLTYTVKGVEKTVRVPLAPFENWSLWRTEGSGLAKPWKTVSPSGMKMMGDDPYHTDWMIGAGLPLDAMNEEGSDLSTVTFELNYKMQSDKMSFSAAVLCGEGVAFGTAVHPKAGERVPEGSIAIIPTANARYLEAALSAAAVVVERGGALAHLITVAREKGVLIMRVEDARKNYPAGSTVSMDASTGTVKRVNNMVRDAFGEFND